MSPLVAHALAGPESGPGRVLDGMRLFARFAYMPNRLGYCGGDVTAELGAYLIAGAADEGLRRHLRTFAGAMPYLTLIASCNAIADPFDVRVVEAYWIGNALLERVDWSRYARDLHDRFRGRLRPRVLRWLVGTPEAGARAHHAFHVFEVSRRLGLPATEGALDLCRIGWGTVTAVEAGAFTVVARPVVTRAGRFALGAPQPERVLRPLRDPVLDAVGVGDVLAFHWRCACVPLAPAQVAALERYTVGALALASRTA